MAVGTSLSRQRGNEHGDEADRASSLAGDRVPGASSPDAPREGAGSGAGSGAGTDVEAVRRAAWRQHLDRVRSVNHHLRLAIDQIGEGVLIIEAEGGGGEGSDRVPRIVFANRAAGALTGHRADELVGEPLGAIYDPEALDHLVTRLPAVARTDKTFQMEKGARCGDGSVEPFRWSIRAVRDEKGRAVNFMMTLRPRIAEVAPESAAAPAGPEAEAGQGADTAADGGGDDRELQAHIETCRIEALAQLAGGIAHDFNNVLTSIFSNLSLAKLASAQGSDVRRHVEDALEASQNAQSLAQQILDFTKGRSQSNELVDMVKVVEQAAKLSTMGSKVRYDVQAEDEVWGVEGDLGQIRQVIHNFLINAGQAMPDGGVVQAMVKNVVVDAEHPVGDLPIGPYVMAGVRDRGCGISAEDLKRIFEPYFTTKTTGSGIGLATCRTIAQRHRGTITVKSKQDAYSEFRLYLPACAIEPATEPIQPIAGGDGDTGSGTASDPPKRPLLPGLPQPKGGGSLTGRRGDAEVIRGQGNVLVVDDQPDVRLSAERLLERIGYRTFSAGDGQEAVQLYRQHFHSEEPISAVLLDMTLPGGLSGDEVMEELRKLDPQARVIATSGWFDDNAEEQFQNDGYVGVLPKPYAVESLSQKLHEALTRR